MPIRALLLQLLIFVILPAILYAPYVGVYAFYWYSLGGPHSQVYGLPGFDWGKLIAAMTLLAWLFSRGTKRLPMNGVTISLILYYLWTCLTTMTARFEYPAHEHLVEWSKIVLMTVVSLGIINNKLRLHGLIWILVLAIGYYGFKGGIFTLVSGGNWDVLGPENTPLFGTNEVARAFLMIIPLAFYLSIHSNFKWVRFGMFGLTGATILAMLGTNSRSALLAFGAMCFVLWLYSRRKVAYLLLTVLVCAAGLVVLPRERLEGMFGRYGSIDQYETDNSFQDRVKNWERIIGFASSSPIVGGGFTLPERAFGLAAHNSYFEVLGEHGYVGLLIWLVMGISALGMSMRLTVLGRSSPDVYWARDLGVMLQCILVGYFVGSITKNHAHFELYYVELVVLVSAYAIVRQALRSRTEAERRAQFEDTRATAAAPYMARQAPPPN